MRLTEGSSSFSKEALALQVFLADRALEALGVVVVVQRFNPAISGLDRESAAHALGGEELVPVFFAVGHSIFEVERAVSKSCFAVRAHEAIGMPSLLKSIQTIALDAMSALPANGSHVAFVAVFAVQFSLLLDEADVLERLAAATIGAQEVIRAPVSS